MKTKRVLRYYCEHCEKAGYRKSGCGKAAMVRHEKHCVHNPNRECRMCTRNDGGLPETPAALAAVIEETMDVNTLREAARGCPACMLAGAAAFNGPKSGWDREEGAPFWLDYKAEHKRFWDDIKPEERCW